jgi:hypothetical protein
LEDERKRLLICKMLQSLAPVCQRYNRRCGNVSWTIKHHVSTAYDDVTGQRLNVDYQVFKKDVTIYFDCPSGKDLELSVRGTARDVLEVIRCNYKSLQEDEESNYEFCGLVKESGDRYRIEVLRWAASFEHKYGDQIGLHREIEHRML